ncbi:MAG: hypothetical protein ABEJ95_06750 [Candidatus Nanohalobium sp.]
MDLEIDESRIFYSLGSFLGVLALIYFGHELIFDLSPTVKTFMLLSGTGLFLSAADVFENGLMKTSLYVLSAFSYLVFLVYMFARFDFTSSQIFAVLTVSSAVFMALGYVRSEKGFRLETGNAKKVIAGLTVLLFAVVLFDVTGAQPEYSLSLREEVKVVEGREFSVGVLEVSNSFPLSRSLEPPSYEGCISKKGNDSRPIYISPSSNGLIAGGETERFNLTDEVYPRRDENVSYSGIYGVENSRCPDKPDRYMIYLSESVDSEVVHRFDR